MNPPKQLALRRVSRPMWRNKARRAIWQLSYWILFRPSPISLHAFRASLLRWFGAKIGRKCRIYPDVRIWAPWNLELGDEVTVGQRVFLYSVGTIKIERYAVISWDSAICTATHDHRSDFTLVTGAVTIGSNAWIAARAFIGPAVSIGKNAVVGACAVVFKDVGASDIVSGNPAVKIGVRPQSGHNNLHGVMKWDDSENKCRDIPDRRNADPLSESPSSTSLSSDAEDSFAPI